MDLSHTIDLKCHTSRTLRCSFKHMRQTSYVVLKLLLQRSRWKCGRPEMMASKAMWETA